MPLTDKQAKSAEPREKTYKLSDEKGLYLEVTPKGQKYWRLKYRFAGKEKRLAIGVYPEVSLKLAREKRLEARDLLSNGFDPSTIKKERKLLSIELNNNSFESIGLEWFKIRQADKTEGHQNRVKRAMEQDLFPTLGSRPIGEINAPDLLNTLRLIENRGAIESAHRTKQIAGQIFRYAIATGRADRDPSADLKGALMSPVKKHFAAITEPKEVGKLMLAIDQSNSTIVVKSALKLSALFFCRPGELRHLKWSDINNEEHRIEITAEKTKQQHIIPLSSQAKDILEQLKPITSRSKYIFPSARGASRCMSENAIRVALRSMGYDNDTMTPHGFRAMARTLLDEVLEYRIEWIEQQLAHAVKDPNGRAYNRTRHLTQRAEMMQAWADYLDRLTIAASHPVQKPDL
jgi:integrase